MAKKHKKMNDGMRFEIAVWMAVILIACALLLNALTGAHRMALLMTAALVVCVYIECQSRVERANAPLILRDECIPEKSKPPETTQE